MPDCRVVRFGAESAHEILREVDAVRDRALGEIDTFLGQGAQRGMMSFDIAIIGAGIAGAALAAEVAPHASVLILEAEDVAGYHATGRSAAFWAETYGGPARPAADRGVARAVRRRRLPPAARLAAYRARGGARR